MYIYIYIYMYMYINIMRGKKDATTFPDKPVLRIASLLLIILLLLINYIY